MLLLKLLLLALVFCPLMPPYPDGGSDAQGRVSTCDHTDSYRDREAEDRSYAEDISHDTNDKHCGYGRNGSSDRTSERLCAACINKFCNSCLGHELSVLSDTVVDNDSIVNRVTEDSQDNSDEV